MCVGFQANSEKACWSVLWCMHALRKKRPSLCSSMNSWLALPPFKSHPLSTMTLNEAVPCPKYFHVIFAVSAVTFCWSPPASFTFLSLLVYRDSHCFSEILWQAWNSCRTPSMLGKMAVVKVVWHTLSILIHLPLFHWGEEGREKDGRGGGDFTQACDGAWIHFFSAISWACVAY